MKMNRFVKQDRMWIASVQNIFSIKISVKNAKIIIFGLQGIVNASIQYKVLMDVKYMKIYIDAQDVRKASIYQTIPKLV